MTPESTDAPRRAADTVPAMVGPDSRLVYIVCHFLAWSFNLVMFAALVWLSYELRSAWPLAGMIFIRGYIHDFNRAARPNTPGLLRQAPQGDKP